MGTPCTWQEEFAMTNQNRSFLEKVLEGTRTVGGVQRGTTPVKSFPEKFHPRRSHLYKKLQIDHCAFFRLKSHGVPTLTAYFLSDMNNKLAVQRKLLGVSQNLSANSQRVRESALELLK